MDAIWLFLVKIDVAFAHHFMATCPPPTLRPCRGASGIGYVSKKTTYLKWWAIQLAIHSIVGEYIDRLK